MQNNQDELKELFHEYSNLFVATPQLIPEWVIQRANQRLRVARFARSAGLSLSGVVVACVTLIFLLHPYTSHHNSSTATRFNAFSQTLSTDLVNVAHKANAKFDIYLPSGGLGSEDLTLNGYSVGNDRFSVTLTNHSNVYQIMETPYGKLDLSHYETHYQIDGVVVYVHKFGRTSVSYLFRKENTWIYLTINDANASFPKKFLTGLTKYMY